MKKKVRNSFVTIFNIIVSIVFIYPATKLDLFKQNYSTLSLTTRGYLYVLVLGIIIGILLGYETSRINNQISGLLMFMFMLIGVAIPHHIPYNLQGNLHLLFAYIGFAGIVIITFINCKIKKYRDIYILPLFIAILLYLKCGMVNTLSEIIVMISTLLMNLVLYIRYHK